MSVYWYLVCDVDRARMDDPLAVDHLRGFDLDGRDEPERGAITRFVAAHSACMALAVRSEHDVDEYTIFRDEGPVATD